MQLLLDENLSYKLCAQLQPIFGEVKHVTNMLGLGATDHDIWEYAKEHDSLIVSKDDDFRQLAVLYGFPPKVIWLNCGNVTNAVILDILQNHQQPIAEFVDDDDASVLIVRS